MIDLALVNHLRVVTRLGNVPLSFAGTTSAYSRPKPQVRYDCEYISLLPPHL